MTYVLYDVTMGDYVSTVTPSFISFDQKPEEFPNEAEADTTKMFIETNFNYDALEVRPYNENKTKSNPGGESKTGLQKVGS